MSARKWLKSNGLIINPSKFSLRDVWTSHDIEDLMIEPASIDMPGSSIRMVFEVKYLNMIPLFHGGGS